MCLARQDWVCGWQVGTLLQYSTWYLGLAADLVCHLLYYHNIDLYSSILPFVAQLKLYSRLYLQCLPFKSRYQQYLSENLSTQQPQVEPKLTHLNITAQTLACFSWPDTCIFAGWSLPPSPLSLSVYQYVQQIVDFSHLAHAGYVILSLTAKSTKIGPLLEQTQLVPSSSASKTVAELLSSEKGPHLPS